MNDIIDTPPISYQQQLNHHPDQQHPHILHTQPQQYRSINQVNGIPSRQSPLHPSSKLYAQPQQVFNTEWVEDSSPNNSPSKLSRILEAEYNHNKMSATITTTQPSKYETPSKPTNPAASFNYITPLSQLKFEVSVGEDAPSLNSTIISNWTIFWSMLNDLVGKDKLAKVSQYTLRLLVYHATKSQTYLSDEHINIKLINDRYNDNEKKEKAAGMINGLSMYRQFLRFGKTPFRLRDLIVKFKQNITFKNNNLEINRANLFNRTTLGQFFSLYYGINDESTLLYKLKVLTDPTYKTFATRHESYGWYCETWLALYNAYENLQNLIQQEMDLKIQIQVKNKAKQISKQLLGGANVMNFSNSSNGSDDSKLLLDIQFKKNNAWIDIYKNLSDLAFNTYTVFQIKLPFDTWQIWMGISASTLSTIKLYRETKRSMIEKELAKLKSE
ncbi:Peroxisomal membrane protein PEX25 [Candida viswanathii]|uniref:Peroxisomal membrane protein PEX25 n=1 Tax=Candida viswanathii TaxID=5486 RepID=A0A367XXF9_9ASCO|nr:Peroxisomal membrane protein PEX25 [Candida viswanathii]